MGKRKKIGGWSFCWGLLGVTVFFLSTWWFCEYGVSNNPLVDEVQNLYGKQSSDGGYFAGQLTAGVFVPLFLCVLVYIRKEFTVYYAVRYVTRDKLWQKEVLYTCKWAFAYVLLFLLVDWFCLFFTASVKIIEESNIIFYTFKYGIILFFFYVLVGILFMLIECFLKKDWNAVILTALLVLCIYFCVRDDIITIWTPINCLQFINGELYHAHSVAVQLFEYGSILCLDFVMLMAGFFLYQKKEYL